ncbi:MAG: hypothetical protein ABFS45_15020 [Pseudomonadota bacterium]
MKKATVLLISLCIVASCSSPPNDEVIIELIQDSMKKGMPLLIIGNALGGKLEKLEVINIEQVEKKRWEPNVFGKVVGKKAHDYWAVTARVKGTARLAEQFGVKGELRGFHARYIWELEENEDGSWSVTYSLVSTVPAQPADPNWWVIAENKMEKARNISTPTVDAQEDDSATTKLLSSQQVYSETLVVNGHILEETGILYNSFGKLCLEMPERVMTSP